MTTGTREQVAERERERIRGVIDGLRPGQWLGSDGLVRSGHPLDAEDLARLTCPAVDGPECGRCGRSRWVPVTRAVTVGLGPRAELVEEARLLCKACGAETADERQEAE